MAESILVCKKCKDLGHSNPSGPFVRFGTNKILIVGEFPKKKYPAEVTNFESPTIKRLAQELTLIGINFDDCSFTELVKCEIDRKDLKKCGLNCFSHFKKQLIILKPEIIISIGTLAKEVFSEIYEKDFQMGELSKIKKFKYLPLYHPSPANPSGHKKNLEIIKKLYA